jgi:hypothetical protein
VEAMAEEYVLGVIFTKLKIFITEKFGAHEYERFLSLLPEEDRTFLHDGQLKPISKVPAHVYKTVSEIMVKQIGQGDPSVFYDYAAKVAMEDLNAAMRFFMKLGTPEFTGRKFDGVYSHYFSKGVWSTVESTSKSLVSKLVDTEPLGEGICWGSFGWTKAALKYSGAKNLRTAHPECVFHGGKQCLFTYHWE